MTTKATKQMSLETFTGIAEQLNGLQSYIDSIQTDKTIYWTNPFTGKTREATANDHFSYIQNCILNISSDMKKITEQAG